MIDWRRRDARQVDGDAAPDPDRRRIGHPHIRRIRPVDMLDRLGHEALPAVDGLAAYYPQLALFSTAAPSAMRGPNPEVTGPFDGRLRCDDACLAPDRDARPNRCGSRR